MTVRVAINGFGRIGRLVLRAIHESKRKDVKVVAINDLGTVDANAHLLRHDSVHGPFPGTVKVLKDGIDIGSGKIAVSAERDPTKLPWGKLDIDVVMECTGIFTKREQAEAHLKAGAKRVLISAPATGADLTVVYGVNDRKLKKAMTVVSNASCTTNCLAPVAKVINDAIGIDQGFMTTVHAYTSDQPVHDTLHRDLRRARGAAMSMVPTSTGAAKAVGEVLPELNGRLDGTAVRVPTSNVSMIDFHFTARRKTTVEEIHAAIAEAAKGPLKGVLSTSSEPLVSIDFNHTSASSNFDLTQTQVMGGKLCRVLAWYDNEWGFSNRMADTAAAMGRLG
jgi:glyceraldehyde 3-phosphate dehydrogenase